MNANNEDMMFEIKEIVASFLGVSIGQLEYHIAAKREAARRRNANKNAAYRSAAEQMTDIQSAVIEKLECEGAKLQNQLWQNRASGNVARMMVKEAWNGAKGRVMSKLIMVYPDGTRTETFEKTISIKKVF